MPRSWSLLLLCSTLAACADTFDDRLAELDARATFDCGEVTECDSRFKADAVVACLQEKLAAGVPAKAFFILGLDPVEYVYALDGSYVSLEGDYYDGPNFTESRCHDVAASGPTLCAQARAIDCDVIRDWGD